MTAKPSICKPGRNAGMGAFCESKGPNAVRLRDDAKDERECCRPAEPERPDAPTAEAIPGPLLEQVLARENLQRALRQVRQNKGAPGIDGMSVEELPGYLKQNWLEIRAALVAGRYRPQPVRRVEIPKPDGRKRILGIPTVLDRFIQRAIAQIVQAQWEPHFHLYSYGFRPRRSAHQAVRDMQGMMASLTRWIETTLHLRVNPRKSAVGRPWKRTFPGFTLSRRDKRLKVTDKAIDKLKARVRQLSQRTRGHKVKRIVDA